MVGYLQTRSKERFLSLTFRWLLNLFPSRRACESSITNADRPLLLAVIVAFKVTVGGRKMQASVVGQRNSLEASC